MQKEKERLKGHITMVQQEQGMREYMLKEAMETVVKYNSSSLADYIEAQGMPFGVCCIVGVDSEH